MRVLIVGDTHCDTRFAREVTKAARASGVQAIIQLGDFCLRLDDSFLSPWRNWLREDEDRSMFWLDGNHDDHGYIDDVIMDGEVPDNPVEHFTKRMFYCPRGSVTKLGDATVQFIGGAYSIDKSRRTAGFDWWPQEMLTDAQVDFAIENGHGVDIICSHDCPNTTWFGNKLKDGDYKVDPASAQNRNRLSEVVYQVSPITVFHGHYHDAYEATVRSSRLVTEVIGLGANIKHGPNGSYRVPVVFGDNVRLAEW